MKTNSSLHCYQRILIIAIALFCMFPVFADEYLKVGDRVTLYFPYEITSKTLAGQPACTSTRPYDVQIVSSTYSSVTIEALKSFSGSPCLINVRYYYNEMYNGYIYQRTGSYDFRVHVSALDPTGVTISPTSMEFNGFTQCNVYATLIPSNAQTTFTWRSTNTDVATVSANGSSGYIFAGRPGTCDIIVTTANGYSASCKVTVPSYEPTSISLPSSLSLLVGESKILTPTISPSNATKNLTWQSSNPSVATVSSSGTVTAVGVGTTRITVRTHNGLSAYCTVTVSKSTLSLSASVASGLIPIGTQVVLTASNNTANIYYTLDGTTPTEQSSLYTAPLIINRPTQLRAQAYHRDYNCSAVLSRDYTTTSLEVTSTYPMIGASNVNHEIIPSITFNTLIKEGECFDEITYINNGSINNQIISEVIISDSSLYFIPTKLPTGSISIQIPQGAIQSKTGDVNPIYTFTFTCKDLPIQVKSVFRECNSYFIDTNNNLWTWGDNYNGGVGNGTSTAVLSPTVIMKNAHKIVNRAPLSKMVGIITKDGGLWIWGKNSNGIYASGNTTYVSLQEPKKFLDNVKDAYISYEGTIYALKNDGTLWAWGTNYRCAVGTGNDSKQLTPVKVLDNVRSISADKWHAFAVKNNNELWAWGYNGDGALGLSNTGNYYPRKSLDNVSSVLAIGTTTYVIKTDKTLWAWGYNRYGQIGNGTTTNSSTPVRILDNVMSMEGGLNTIVALKYDGTLWGWGENSYGQLGLGNKNPVYHPVQIATDVAKVTLEYSTAIVKTDGTLWVCGSNTWGELGIGHQSSVYTLTKNLDNVKDVHLEVRGGGAITKSGDLYTWGYYPGNGTSVNGLTPIKIFPLNEPTLDSINLNHSQIILAPQEYSVLQLIGSPISASFTAVWESSNDSIVTVSAKGIIQAQAIGEATIAATISTPNEEVFTCSCTVIVQPSTSISIIKTNDNTYTRKVFENGTIYIFRNGEKYTIDGRKVE